MPRHNLRILLVEDHPFQLIATQALLNNQGYFLLTPALNAAEAFAALERSHTPYDLLLCDQRLPDLPGLELVGQAWRKGLVRQAIIFSGLTEEGLLQLEHTARRRALPLLGCLSKPLRAADLARLLDAP
ncbi:response regulator [Pseudomonas sp. 21LCFQ02]|nr:MULTISPECIES: response regulator [unclassified Pseudomonas]MCO8167988.1 response regulator [Pseudomonas sp. 21LCFQ02]MCQ9423236.1 response regulator [Pseudomonas sp. LJDD11]